MTSLAPAASTRVAPARTPPSLALLWAGGSALLWIGYLGVLWSTGPGGALQAAQDATCNVLPLSLLALAVRAVLNAEVMRRSNAAQAVWHAGLAVAFSFTWYATLVLLLATAGELRGGGFHLYGFHGPALTWQAFQGLLLYATTASLCYAVRGGRAAASVTFVEERAPPAPLTRYLIRRGDELTPVDVADIVSVTGAQDYAEVATLAGRHLVRLSLGELEARLDPARFVRVHRSAIINLHRLERTEPAGGGRLLAHMANGDVVAVNRSGVQALRRFVV